MRVREKSGLSSNLARKDAPKLGESRSWGDVYKPECKD